MGDWFNEWREAAQRNVEIFRRQPRVVALARGWALFSTTRVARFIRARVPYEFDGDHHAIGDWDEVMVRGYGACADGSAIAAALFHLAGRRDVRLCYETVPAFVGYAHARIAIGGRFVEPWPEQRRPEAKACSMLVDVSEVLRE